MMANEYTIVICAGCGKKFRIYMHAVYTGDTRYCPKCNKESGEDSDWKGK